MSTRASIIIKNEKTNEVINLYHHCDGYPDGVGCELAEFFSKYYNNENWYWNVSEIANELVKSETLDGYEIATAPHQDIEFLYLIDCEAQSLKCYKRDFGTKVEECICKENETFIPYAPETLKELRRYLLNAGLTEKVTKDNKNCFTVIGDYITASNGTICTILCPGGSCYINKELSLSEPHELSYDMAYSVFMKLIGGVLSNEFVINNYGL